MRLAIGLGVLLFLGLAGKTPEVDPRAAVPLSAASSADTVFQINPSTGEESDLEAGDSNDAEPQARPECRFPCKTACGEEDAELPGFDCPGGTVCCMPPRAPVETCDGTCRAECSEGETATTRGCPGNQLCCKPLPTPPE